ncbi:FAD-dependent oxidoreductase [Candidatus Parcubacteria bacterium]|nr:FAD-dependent oxidoreductase [Candidatus Parcubacteria bacterium]
MKVVFNRSEASAKNIITCWFSKPAHIHHIAGQFIELYLPHENPDARGERHWFTLSSSPTEKTLSITTKISSEGSSFKRTLRNLKPGDQVLMAEPMGDFVLPKDPFIPLLFVAGGIGCTPYRSMVKYLQDCGEKRSIKLIYAALVAQEIAFRDIFDQLGDDFIPLVGQKLTSQKILAHASPSHYIYLSGPEPMVESLDKQLKQTGVSPDHIRTDFFLNYSKI